MRLGETGQIQAHGSVSKNGCHVCSCRAARLPRELHVEADTRRPIPDEALISIPELADWLGVSVHAVKKWCTRGPASGQVPRMLRVNGQIRFRPQDVREWLDSKVVR